MKLDLKVILLLISLFTIGGLLLYMKVDHNTQTNQLNEQLMQANLEIGKAKTAFGNANKHINDLDKSLKSVIKRSNEHITRYSELEFKYEVLSEKKRQVVTEVVYRDKIIHVDDNNLFFEEGRLYEGLDDSSLQAVDKYSFDFNDFRIDINCTLLNMQDNLHGSWRTYMSSDYKLHMRFGGQIVETITPSGAINHYIRMFELDDEDKSIRMVDLVNFSTVIDNQTRPRFRLWAPHIDVGAFVGADLDATPHVSASVGFSTSGYGLTKNDLSWRFLRISADFNSDVGIGLSPALYNFGEVIPLFSNVWIGPHISKGLNTNWTLGILLGANL